MSCEVCQQLINFNKLILMLALIASISGCEVDDQSLASKNQISLINPTPTSRDFAYNNSHHEVLVAVIDSGVDYNHPSLQKNIHFEMDATLDVTGAGWDFLANDSWPAPYLARTDDINPITSLTTKEKSKLVREVLNSVIKYNPVLIKFLNPDRLVEVERQVGTHGTHVAGLVTQGDDRIGLLPYRISLVDSSDQSKLGNHLRTFVIYEKLVDQIIAAIEKSALSGARIVNMSFAYSGAQSLSESNSFEIRSRRIADVIKKYSNIIFVASAGNQSKSVDEGSQFPCGLNLPNLICAVAIDSKGDGADFTNLPDKKLRQIGALGVDLVSSVPTLICNSQLLKSFASTAVYSQSEFARENLSNNLRNECVGNLPFETESGTSMSAPVISHELAKILIEENRDLTPTDAFDELVKRFPQGITKVRAY